MIQLRLLAETTSRVTYNLARFDEYTERWHYLALTVACVVIVGTVAWLYRRDTRELRPSVTGLLVLLRAAALLGMLAFYLGIEKHTERKLTHHSRVLVMVDTSLSMGLHDSDASPIPASPTRLGEVVDVLGGAGLIQDLRKKHDVVLARFDSDVQKIGTFQKVSGEQGSARRQLPPRLEKLMPQGMETRLGQSVRQLLDAERANPLAAVVLFSDGQQNAGPDPAGAVDAAREAKIPIYTVGIGSDRRPANVRVSDLVAPSRAYPGDSFTVTGYVQASELGGRALNVELFSSPASSKRDAPQKLEGAQRVVLTKNNEAVPIRFDITPAEAGRRTYRLRIAAPPDDINPSDNQQEVDVDIVDRKTKVLLVASGPTREYVFLRNQLRRDEQMVVDVWLQSARAGISQDAHAILDSFPTTPQELYEYDAVVGFDPDWTRLDAAQIDLLERWVAERAGGLIVLAGPVQMDHWVQDPKYSKVRALYPVEFQRRLTVMEEGRFGSEVAWPIQFTREGLEAEFLWLTDSAATSQQAWSEFPGVFGYYPVRGPKPGAVIYGRYSDPEEAGLGQQNVYIAGQFYGAGRVVYLGSGEMWRLRAVDENYFDQIYTKLVRHVTQGRLLLGSSRGMLLVDRERFPLGASVALRAQLNDARYEPLELPSVRVQVLRPDTTGGTVELSRDPNRRGLYMGQFAALQEGTYRLELAVPGSNEQLTRRIQVRIPDLERENTERNDALLGDIAKRTGGQYYVGAASVMGAPGTPPLATQLKDRTTVTYLSGVSDLEWQEGWMKALLALVAGALALEWTLRRLSKLA